jgi:4-hydroxy-tetrahydrodipicolinate reductase
MSKDVIKVAVNGAAGRMGQRLIALAKEDAGLDLVCAIEAAGHPLVGTVLGGVTISDTLIGRPSVVVDFSHPSGMAALIAAAVNAQAAMVIGTTGLTANQQTMIDHAAHEIPIVQAPNMSVGVNVLLKVLAEAAKALGDGYDIEIVESHHRFKKDAPSGTALALAQSICDATSKDMQCALVHGRSGEAPRQPGTIGMHAVRLGDTVGEHSVYFGNLGETITISHSAHTRDTFACGALRAATWVAGRKPGT